MPRERLTLLIAGCGDIGMRVLRLLDGRWRVLALTSSADRVADLRGAAATPLIGNLDEPATLGRLGALADAVLMLAPPSAEEAVDTRSIHLMRALARAGRVQRVVYVSTSGVYGDRAGELIDETRALKPTSARAARRADAEARWRWYGRTFGATVTILRVPGIYAKDRPGGDPRERLQRGTPALTREQDVYTNHIQADDLARTCLAALVRGRAQRVFNVSDDSVLKMGDYFDVVADLHDMPRPDRLTRSQLAAVLSPMQLSFMSESRRLDNTRLKRELRVVLRYPTVREGLA